MSPTHHTVLFRFAYTLVYAMMRKGWSEEDACHSLGFPRLAETQSLYRLPLQHLLRACHQANKAGGHALYCVELGRLVRLEDYGPIARTLSFFSTARVAFALYSRMSWLLKEPAAPVPIVKEGEIIVRLNPTPEDGQDYRPLVELNISIMVSLYHQATGGFGRSHLKCVHFQHSPPLRHSVQQYEKLLGCPVFFHQTDNALVIDERAADLPMHTADSTLLQSTQAQFVELNAALNDKLPTSQRIIALIHEGEDYQLTIDRVAQHFDTSVSTLKRRLKKEGSSFQKLLDQARLEQAVQQLNNGGQEIADIAKGMGYQSAAAFSRAFKKWLGISPRDYRKHQE